MTGEGDLPSVAELEAGTVDPARFDHRAHVFVAWQLLAEAPVFEAIDRYATALRRLTERLGVPEKYHATITWFYVLTIAERRAHRAPTDWDEFARANPDLLEPPKAFLARHYTEARLASDVARRQFVLPDRRPARWSRGARPLVEAAQSFAIW